MAATIERKGYPKNFATYPQNVKDIIENDLLKREKNDPVRIAYDLAERMHQNQKRDSGLDYITHPVQVYDMVNRCIGKAPVYNKDVTLCAALLHDAIEDYMQAETKRYKELQEAGMTEDPFLDIAPIHPKDARSAAVRLIQNNFPDPDFADPLIKLLDHLTNPTQFKDKDHKRKVQIDKMQKASPPAKLIKICDQATNVVSDVNEKTEINYDEVVTFANKATGVVKAIFSSEIKQKGVYTKPITAAANAYFKMSEEALDIFKKIKPHKQISINEYVDAARLKIEGKNSNEWTR
mgnify:CR=1 FL=1